MGEHRGNFFQNLIADGMTVCIVDGFEMVHINQNQSNGIAAVFKEIQHLVESAAVQHIGERVMVGLMMNPFLRFLVFEEHFVIGDSQLLQLCRAGQGETLAFLDALQVFRQRVDNDFPQNDAKDTHANQQEDRCNFQFQIHISEYLICPVLNAVGLCGKLCHAAGDAAKNPVPGVLIIITGDQSLRPLLFSVGGKPLVLDGKLNLPENFRPIALVRLHRLGGQPHGIQLRGGEILGMGKSGFQFSHGIGIAEGFLQRLQSVFPPLGHIQFFQISIAVGTFPGNRVKANLLGQIVRAVFQLQRSLLTENIFICGSLQLAEVCVAEQGSGGKQRDEQTDEHQTPVTDVGDFNFSLGKHGEIPPF